MGSKTSKTSDPIIGQVKATLELLRKFATVKDSSKILKIAVACEKAMKMLMVKIDELAKEIVKEKNVERMKNILIQVQDLLGSAKPGVQVKLINSVHKTFYRAFDPYINSSKKEHFLEELPPVAAEHVVIYE